MASKLTLIDISSGFKGTDVNTNFTSIEDEFDDTLSRSGKSPNQMEANIDMNSNLLRNLGVPTNNSDAIRLADITDNSKTATATAVTIEDTGGFYSSDNVEGALAEIGPDTEEVELGNDFDAGEKVVCGKSGDRVIITSVGILGHSSTSSASSTAGVIPSRFRPTNAVTVCTQISSSFVAQVTIQSSGTLQTLYLDWSGGFFDKTSLGGFSISYLIT